MATIPPQTAHERRDGYGLLILIAIFKLLKAALLIAVGIIMHHLLHKDVPEEVRHWVHAVRIDPDNRYIHAFLSKLTGVTDRKLEALSIGTFLYATLFVVEGTGLMLRKRWAEYLTIISTAAFLPLEVYELIHRRSAAKVVLLLANVLIVIYLIVRLYRTRPHAGQEST